MTISLASLTSGGGGGGGASLFKPVAFTSGDVASGTSGAILTDTAGTGQYFKIRYLLTATSATEKNVTLTIDGTDVFSGEDLADASPIAGASSSVFGVATGFGNSTPNGGARILPYINCTSFTLAKDTGTTANTISYAYETLEAI